MRPDPDGAFVSPDTSLAARIRNHDWPDSTALAQALAERVADNIRSGIETRGTATIALSGGTTPKRFLQALSRSDLDWSRLQVTVADERWVTESEIRSNSHLLHSWLFQGPAAAAEFISLYVNNASAQEAVPIVAGRIAALSMPFDAVVLGMGDDGHFASLFPGADGLALALDPHSSATIIAIRAVAAPEPRMSLTLATLLRSRHTYLHIEGESKRSRFAAAIGSAGAAERLPVRALVENLANGLDLYWCP
ncbi:MAG: 6-phosphogluconolactonase [Tahibacter sp.]